MEKAKKIKLFVGLFYLTAICLFLYFFFSKFSLQEITSYDFIRENRSYFFELKNSNLFLLSIIFLGLTILWVFPFLGFGSPVALMGGFIFGKWIGTLLVVLGLSVGATFIYLFGNYFLKELIREKFLNKFQNLEQKFKKSEFIYLLIYRFIGGIPWQLSCLLPTLFNVKVNNFFRTNNILGVSIFRIWFPGCIDGWIYIWKMDWNSTSCFRIKYWWNFHIFIW